jgi:hypothetical protein
MEELIERQQSSPSAIINIKLKTLTN